MGILTFLSLAHMVDAMQRMQLGGVGMLTFLASAHMTDATQVMAWCRFTYHIWATALIY